MTINATPIRGTGPFNYNWEGPNDFHTNSLSPTLVNLNSSSSGTYAVTITDFNNCTSENSIEIDVKPGLSQPNITTNGTVCEGEAIIFSTEVLIGNRVSYEWTGPNSKSTTNGDFPNAPSIVINSASLEDSGNYNLKVTVDGCSAQANSVEIVVYEKAKATPTNNGGICGANLELFANPAFSNNDNYLYQWAGPNGFLSNDKNPIIENPDFRNEGSYSLIITNENGCTSNMATTEVSLISANLNQPFIYGENMLCQGEHLVLSTVQVSGPNVVYEWIGPNNTSTTNGDYLNSPILKIDNVTTLNNGDYQVQVIVGECQTVMSAAFPVEVSATPSIQLSNSGTACVKPFEDIQLFAIPSNSNSNLSYKWVGPNGFLSTNQNPILPNVRNNYSGTYTLTATNSNGCEQTLSIVLDISISEIPVLSLSTNEICEGENLFLQATDYQKEEAKYYWSIGSDSTETYITTTPSLYLEKLTASQAGFVEVVVDIAGCTSQASKAEQLIIYPLPKQPDLDVTEAICEGTSLRLSTNAIADNYQWTGPNGFVATIQQPKIIENVSSQNAGIYVLRVSNNGCESAPNSAEVRVLEKPAQPILVTKEALCFGEDIQLSVSNSITGNTYQWIPPSLSIGQFPDKMTDTVLWTDKGKTIIRKSAFPEYYESGAWSVRSIDTNGCISDISPPSRITINPVPEAPVLFNSPPVCEGTNFQLKASNLPNSNNIHYKWTGPNGFSSNSPTPLIESLSFANSGNYTLSIRVEGCSSLPSSPMFLQVKASPDKPEISANGTIASPLCEGQTLQLQTSPQQGATYHWVGPNGFSSNLPNVFIPNVSLNQAGSYMLSMQVEDCFSPSAIIEVDIQATPDLPIASNSSPVCINDNLVLSVSRPVETITYEWFKTIGNEFIGTGASLVLENVDIRDAGSYYVLASEGACATTIEEGTSEMVEAFTDVIVEHPAKEVAYIEENILYTCEAAINLFAKEPQLANGFWSVLDNTNSIAIISPNNAATPIENLQVGQNIFVWSIESGVCGITSTDTLLVERGTSPIANNDTFSIGINDVLSLQLLANDEHWTSDANIYLLSDLILGRAIRNQGNIDFANSLDTLSQFTYIPSENAVGTEIFTYKICNKECPDLCSEATVVIRIGEDVECFASHLVTPNNDGFNDSFIVPCLVNYEGSSFTVFNRWGDEVYHSDNYQNDWYGTYQNAPLPTGTYYYTLNINDGLKTALNGYLFIQR